MEGFLDPLETLDSRRFLIAVKRLADSLSYGTDRSPFLGPGIEYVQSRPYQWGDPIRTIDWRVTARAGEFYVKEYEAPKQLPCLLLVDTSASMTISSTRRSKYAVAVYLAGGLALACLDRMSPVGVLGIGSQRIRVQPSLSRAQILQWLHRLRHYRFDEETELSSRIAEIGATLTTRALIVAITDLHDVDAVSSLKHLAQRHDVVVIEVRDPAELSLKGSGFLRAQEAETGRTFTTHGRRKHLDQEETRRHLKRSGIDHLILETEERFDHKVQSFFGSRDILGKGTR